ncbi:hypothetical protein F5Y13DRAFT_166075 [Hypoxylon sp. FL1857]|nr:hypothetical protein F5Y13DRAFT_166075 [Hypoxylon sp. FL1857]
MPFQCPSPSLCPLGSQDSVSISSGQQSYPPCPRQSAEPFGTTGSSIRSGPENESDRHVPIQVIAVPEASAWGKPPKFPTLFSSSFDTDCHVVFRKEKNIYLPTCLPHLSTTLFPNPASTSHLPLPVRNLAWHRFCISGRSTYIPTYATTQIAPLSLLFRLSLLINVTSAVTQDDLQLANAAAAMYASVRTGLLLDGLYGKVFPFYF